MKRKLQLLTGIGCLCLCFLSCSQPPYKNPALSPEERANDLVGRLTLEEKAALMQNTSPAIPRLGIKAYDWWNEALHGVGRPCRTGHCIPASHRYGSFFQQRTALRCIHRSFGCSTCQEYRIQQRRRIKTLSGAHHVDTQYQHLP